MHLVAQRSTRTRVLVHNGVTNGTEQKMEHMVMLGGPMAMRGGAGADASTGRGGETRHR